MKKEDIRGAISQAEMNDEASDYLFGEIIILSIALGFFTKSWWVFGIVLIGTIIAVQFKTFAIIICVLFSLCWGAIGFYLGSMFSTSASIVLAILAFIIGVGIHLSAMEWVNDVSEDE